MASDLLFWALVTVATALSAFPATLVALWLMGKSEWLRKAIRSQILDLPTLLKEPAVRVAMTDAIKDVTAMGSGDISKAMSGMMLDAVNARMKEVSTNLNEQMGALMSSSITAMENRLKGTYGQMIKQTKAQIVGGTGGKGGLGWIGEALGIKERMAQGGDDALSMFK